MTDDQQARLNQVNVIVGDIQAAIAFYRLLGADIVVSAGEWPAGSGARHAATAFDNGVTLEFDNLPMLHIYAADAGNVRGPVIGFAFPSREAVDAAFNRLSSAGHVVRRRPYDAFWGARYAIVEDPDGNAVGLMGPIDRSRGYTPGPA